GAGLDVDGRPEALQRTVDDLDGPVHSRAEAARARKQDSHGKRVTTSLDCTTAEGPMADLESFRRETRAWIESNAPQSLRGLGNDPLHGVWGGRRWRWGNADQRTWLGRRAAGRWAGVARAEA